MMRQAQSALRLLLRLQAAREREREANSAANGRAAWTEHCAIRLMAQALSPPPEPEPVTELPTQGPAAEPEMVGQPEPEPVAAEACPSTDPQWAAPLRHLRPVPDTIIGLPPVEEAVPARMAFRPPDGARLDRRLAEAPIRLAHSETRQP